ncbi:MULTISPECIES: NAD+ synthase [unclassified Haladaptatus]|uniref:NAD+ synthase n=1 Tax=unclassified Haladaptatus TaxID=2622732 RepID=UPI00209C5C53|nr:MULTISPECIES: NAD+ synthase [unclassified Haladaptatus]MCO8242955.1 NAD+ synthase [Haladaptatus sp. AB643]MCO8252711.1 NAD+ synthase [Haladaptatus sp. AB618]
MIDLELSTEELDAHRDHIVSFIRETVADAGTDSAVLGLSGGIDSTLTAYLAVEALGTENVHGLVMPGAVSREDNMSDAEWVASDLEITYDVFEINPIVDTFLDAYSEAEGDHMAVGNARARTRAVMNYLVANHEGSVVLGTGNRTEALVGYFTKYGDGAVDCHPIGNLYKQQVRQLAVHVGVPERLAEKEATAGLWAGQTDEEELGIDYDTLDAILALHVDGPLSASATARQVDGASADDVRRIDEMYRLSEHKRAVPQSPESL